MIKDLIPSGIQRTFQALANRPFRFLWFGLLFAQAAMQINIVSRAWLAYTISGSAFALGIVAFARGLPLSIFSLLGGATADRSNKRTLLIMVQFGLGGLAAIIALLVHFKVIRIWHMAVIGLLQGIISAFNSPVRQALIPILVDDKMLPSALALGSTTINLNRAIAPAFAGVLLTLHPALAFDSVAIFYIVSGFLLFRLPKTETSKTSKTGNVFTDIGEGFAYLFRNRNLILILVMAFIPTMIWRPFRELLPVFQQTVLNVNPSALGVMYTVVGIGALVGSLAAASLSPTLDKRFIQGVAGLVLAGFITAFSISKLFPLSLFFLMVIGLTGQGYMTINSIFLMQTADADYYGRVMSVYLLNFSLAPIAILGTGYLVDRFGLVGTEMTAGIILTLVMIIFLSLRRRLALPERTGNH